MAGVTLSYYAQANQLKAIRRDRADVAAVNFSMLQAICRRARRAYDNFFRRVKAGEGAGFPQLVYTANLFGVLAVRAAMDILSGRPVRKRVVASRTLARPVCRTRAQPSTRATARRPLPRSHPRRG